MLLIPIENYPQKILEILNIFEFMKAFLWVYLSYWLSSITLQVNAIQIKIQFNQELIKQIFVLRYPHCYLCFPKFDNYYNK